MLLASQEDENSEVTFGFRNKETISYIGKKFLWSGRGKIKAVSGEVSCNQRHKTTSVDKLLKVAERGQRGRWEEAVIELCAESVFLYLSIIGILC